MSIVLSGIMLTVAIQAAAQSPFRHIYCSVMSTSPRGSGLIVTPIFRSRLDRTFVETAFANHLRNSYAPYGNGWVFVERDVSCSAFERRRDAQRALDLVIARMPRPTQTIYTVNFQI